MKDPAVTGLTPEMRQKIQLRFDFLKLTCVLAVFIGLAGIFVVNPTLSTPTLLSIVISMLLSPVVASLERKNLARGLSIFMIFLLIGGILSLSAVFVTRSAIPEWESFSAKAPVYFRETVDKFQALERQWKDRYRFLESVQPTASLLTWGEETGKWFLSHGPKLVGDLLAWLFLVPILTFVMLKDGPALRKRIFELVPNRVFEPAFMMSTRILDSISDYIRAKLVEAFLLGLMCFIGLASIGAPYSLVLALIAGVTNILPYLGPIVGAVPGIVIAALDPSYHSLLVPMIIVYGVANLIDTVLIFPILVAKLVNLHPLILIAVVIIGGQYSGLVGMLLSIPIATALKVVLQQIYVFVYRPKPG